MRDEIGIDSSPIVAGLIAHQEPFAIAEDQKAAACRGDAKRIGSPSLERRGERSLLHQVGAAVDFCRDGDGILREFDDGSRSGIAAQAQFEVNAFVFGDELKFDA